MTLQKDVSTGAQVVQPTVEPASHPGSSATLVVVPDAIGVNVLEAHRLLREQRLRIAISVWETKVGPWGLALSQDPAPGSMVRAGARVHVVVAGRPHSTVPDVRDLDVAAAMEILRNVGLRPEVEIERRSRSVPSGHVIATKPAEGSLVADGSRVALVVSRAGPASQPRPRAAKGPAGGR